ncbi:unnamed protein product [Rhodiola kirilowii]
MRRIVDSMEALERDLWGNTSSDDCIAAINAFYHQVLNYGRGRSVILKAPERDSEAAHYVASSDPSRVSIYLEAAKSRRSSH